VEAAHQTRLVEDQLCPWLMPLLEERPLHQEHRFLWLEVLPCQMVEEVVVRQMPPVVVEEVHQMGEGAVGQRQQEVLEGQLC
jgi:hypothetical protein